MTFGIAGKVRNRSVVAPASAGYDRRIQQSQRSMNASAYTWGDRAGYCMQYVLKPPARVKRATKKKGEGNGALDIPIEQ